MFSLTVYKPTEPWNKNKIVGQKLPLKLQQIWAIRIRLELVNKQRVNIGALPPNIYPYIKLLKPKGQNQSTRYG
jgi:hypothetical protein